MSSGGWLCLGGCVWVADRCRVNGLTLHQGELVWRVSVLCCVGCFFEVAVAADHWT
jgi:hypothetical protein